ncbi:hypothetical protein M9Y10_004683 [Tritrichomonas musculus]|uniref:Uncharacterized protein n=1 Tax=Tritrichomonas musculus TaxID=1915356 RepID=A0ABR2JJM9_9EUKA
MTYSKELNRLREQQIEIAKEVRRTNTHSLFYTLDFKEELVDELFTKNNCTILRKPKHLYYDSKVTFYRNDNPNRYLVTKLGDFLNNPNYNFQKSLSKTLKPNATPEEIKKSDEKFRMETAEQLRKRKEDKLRESMLKENCILTSPYELSDKLVHYTFEGLDYAITPTKWNKGIRSHKMKFIRYTQEHIAQLFAKEGCELISKYVNQKSRLEYKYQGKTFHVVWNDWKFYNSRPHLGNNRTYFSEESKK